MGGGGADEVPFKEEGDETRNQEQGEQETGKGGSDAVAAVVVLARLMLTGRTGADNLERHSTVSGSDPGAGFFQLKAVFPVTVACWKV